jgi:hypothetical protein
MPRRTDRTDDLDLVLVGPGGAWAVQVKATGAPLRVHAGRWQVRRGGRWVAAKSQSLIAHNR